MQHKVVRYGIVGLVLFVGVMAIYGGVSLLIDAAGFGVKEEWLQGSPFTNYQIPAVGLLVGVAGSSLLSAIALLKLRGEAGILLSIGAGVVLMAFEVVETYAFGLRNVQQPLMFALGLVIAALAAFLWHEEVGHGAGGHLLTPAH